MYFILFTVNRGACRAKGETTEEKKVRKAAIKAEKKASKITIFSLACGNFSNIVLTAIY